MIHQMEPSLIPDYKPNFLEKSQDYNYFRRLLFFALYCDIASLVVTGHGIKDFRLSQVDQSFPFGYLFIAAVAYFAVFRSLATIRDWTIQILWKPLCWIYKEASKEEQDSIQWDNRLVPLSDVKAYALKTSNSSLLDEVRQHENRSAAHRIYLEFSFAFWILLWIDILVPGLFFHDILDVMDVKLSELLNTAVVFSLILKLIAGFYSLTQWLPTFKPFSLYDGSIYLPNHPLSDERRAFIEKQREEKAHLERIRSGMEDNIQLRRN